MTEELLDSILEGKIPPKNVCNWLLNENVEPQSSDDFPCTRGEFALCILNFLRQSSARSLHTAGASSPIKSITKGKSAPSSIQSHGFQRNSGKPSGRRTELFPSLEPTSEFGSGGRNQNNELLENSGKNLQEHVRLGVQTILCEETAISNSAPCTPQTLNNCHRGYLQKLSPNQNIFGGRTVEQNPFCTPEIGLSMSSSPFASSPVSDGSPHLTPIRKRQSSAKLSDKGTPTNFPSPSENLASRTHSRSSGICFGDFITSTGAGSRNAQSKKRLSMSPNACVEGDQNVSSPLSGQHILSGDLPQSSLNKKNRKQKRRINPTKVAADGTNPCSQAGFREVPSFGSLNHPLPEISPFQELITVESSDASQSFSEERNLLKQERLRLQSLNDSSHVMVTPTKLNVTMPISVTPQKLSTIAPTTTLQPSHVSFKDHLIIISDLYCTLLNANLVPNLMSELYFVLLLLVVQSDSLDIRDNSGNSSMEIMMEDLSLHERESKESTNPTVDSMTAFVTPKKIVTCNDDVGLDQLKYLRSAPNCAFFATRVLWYQRELLCHLDRVTLKLLWENERIALFMPQLVEYIGKLYTAACRSRMEHTSVSTLKTVGCGNVAYQSETDNNSNFPSAQSFSNFRKQRDGFYELLTIWEANHMVPGWNFYTVLGSKVRNLLQLHSDPVNYTHLARLFRLQLIATVGGESTSLDEEGPEDLQFLQRLGVDPEKLNRLKERLVTPLKTAGPRPPPAFPGLQEFYKDFIHAASSFIFIQHLQDSLICHLMELNQTPFMGSDMEDSETSVDEATRHNYLSCVCTMRLLAKFLGLIVFLPYQRPETKLPDSIVDTEVFVRTKVVPPLNLFTCVLEAYQTNRLVVTLPWVVKFLGMMDNVSWSLPYYKSVVHFLFNLYISLRHDQSIHKNGGRALHAQSVFMLRLCLGWLFESPVFPDSIFCTWCPSTNNLETILASYDGHIINKPCGSLGDTSFSTWNVSAASVVSSESIVPVDSLNLINQEMLYALCPYLVELRAVLAAVPGAGAASGGSVRHITPLSTSFAPSSPSTTAKHLELQLEESFFHGLPASVHKTVEFVVERVTSCCVKHICSVWLPGLKENGVQMLRKIIQGSLQGSNETEMRVLQRNLSREVHKIVEQVSTNLKSKCRSGLNDICAAKCHGALMSLLSEDSLGTSVCEMCVSVATRMSIERVVSWMQTHATLSMYSKDLQSEVDKALKQRERSDTNVTAKTSHIAPGESAGWEHDDTAPSPAQIMQSLKLLVCDVLDGRGENISRGHVLEFLEEVEQTVTKRQDVFPAAERALAALIVDLVVALVCHCPYMVDSALIKCLIRLWKLDALLPVEDGLSRIVCPRNMLLLAQSVHPQRYVWEKLADVVAAVLQANLVTPELIENQCLAIMQQEWPQSILRSFAICMNEVVRQYTKQKDADYKFILLVEWLAETMVQMDYFPDS